MDLILIVIGGWIIGGTCIVVTGGALIGTGKVAINSFKKGE